MTTEILLVIALAAYVVAASWGGAYYLLLANLGFSLFVQDTVDIAGLYVNPSDLMFLVLVGGCVTSPGFARSVRLRSAPYFRVWLLLGVVLSISYIMTRQQLLSDPLRAIYQVYRYCWKPILYYPLAAALTLGSSRRKEGV
ncbi:MAG TPA: hypothetical protein VFO62_09930, partial [Candidatus Binatia bacterium]|nr:hypothetical protein [Candidatus Binatia bacterium]